MRPQHYAADAAIVSDLANQEQTCLPVQIRAWPELHQVPDVDRASGFGAIRPGGGSGADQEGLECGEFIFGEHGNLHKYSHARAGVQESRPVRKTLFQKRGLQTSQIHVANKVFRRG